MDEDGDGYGLAGNCLGFDCNDNTTVYPGATEVCDDLDNDCDSKTDARSRPIEADSKMEGVCAGTQPECQDGEWTCTYPETYQADAESTCDNLDNDCDGGLDEDFNFEGDPNNCGGCGIVCMVPRAAAACVQFQCLVGTCQEGWHDIDMDPSNGCEYACVASAGGEELCDGEEMIVMGKSMKVLATSKIFRMRMGSIRIVMALMAPSRPPYSWPSMEAMTIVD